MRRKALVSLVALFMLAAAAGVSSAEQGDLTGPYPGDIVYTGTGKSVVFSHEFHAGGMGFACDSCHTEVFELREGAASDAGDFKMSVMEDGKYCGKCHDGSTAFSVADFMLCNRCHAGDAGAKVQPGLTVLGPQDDIMLGMEGTEARFPHPSHSMFSCDKCHTAIFPIKKTQTVTSMDDINAGKACGVCHNGSVAFDATNCGMCHPGM